LSNCWVQTGGVLRRWPLGTRIRATVVSTNKVFAEWTDVFPNAACVVTLVDRLVHRAEIITIEGDSYRLMKGCHPANCPFSR